MIKAIIFDLDNTLTHRNESVVNFCQQFICDFSMQTDVSHSTLYQLIVGIDNNGRGNSFNTHTKSNMLLRLRLATTCRGKANLGLRSY